MRWAIGLAGAFLAVGVIMALLAIVADKTPGRATGDGPAISLVGVRPDGSDDVFDAAGTPVGRSLAPAGGESRWGADNHRRDFILDVPATDGAILWMPVPTLADSEGRSQLSLSATALSPDGPLGKRLVLSCTFPWECSRGFAWFWERSAPVECVDLTLRYFLGARGKPDLVFTGPFAVARAARPDGGQDYELTPSGGLAPSRCRLRLRTSRPFDIGTAVLAYDASGRRHLPVRYSGQAGRTGANVE